MTEITAISVLCIAVAGVAAQWVAWRLRLPAIVLLFAVGLVLGPGLQVLVPREMFGNAVRPLVSLAVAIVVFEGGLALDFRELRAAGEGVLRLTVLALPISFGFAAVAGHLLGDMEWGIACLFGAITVVTGPTVVLPLLRHTRLERRTAAFFKWEAIVNDPVGALLAAGVLATLAAHDHRTLALSLLMALTGSVALGIGAGFFVRWLFSRDRAPEVLKVPILLAGAFGVFATSNLMMDEAGLAAATVFGVTLANLNIPGLRDLARFKEALVVLLVSALFIVLTAGLDRTLLTQMSWPVLLLTVAMLVLVRPAAIALATLGSGLTWRERVLAGWIAPRGIVAAAVAGVASTQLSSIGYPGAEKVMPAVFALIAATMVLHGFSLAPLARKLKLTLGDTPGVAIVGASAWTIQLSEVLARAGIATLLVDTYPGALDPARRLRLPVLQAELLSEHGVDALEESRVDYLVAATPDELYNSLVSTRLIPDLGRYRVFQLTSAANEADEDAEHSAELRGQVLGAPTLSFSEIRDRFRQGWRFKFVGTPDASDPAETVEILFMHPDGALRFAAGEALDRGSAEGGKLLVFAAPVQPAQVRAAFETTSGA